MKVRDVFTKVAPVDILKTLDKSMDDRCFPMSGPCMLEVLGIHDDDVHSCPKHKDCDKCIEDAMNEESSLF